MLRKHRCGLMDSLHESQGRVDYLDFLVWKMDKELLKITKKKERHYKMENIVKLELTKEWDKTFPKSEKVSHRKVTFPNRYGITLAADLYEPKGAEKKLAAIAVCGPFGAVK